MTTLTPFKAEFCGKVRDIYSVNSSTPEREYSSVTTLESCPHCKERNIFRFYNPKREFESDRYIIEIYDCKCPKCKEYFEFMDVCDKLED